MPANHVTASSVPQLINRVAMGLARFLRCTGLFFFWSVTRPKPPLSQIVIGTLNRVTFDVYLPKAVETLMQGKCYGYFLYCV